MRCLIGRRSIDNGVLAAIFLALFVLKTYAYPFIKVILCHVNQRSLASLPVGQELVSREARHRYQAQKPLNLKWRNILVFLPLVIYLLAPYS